MLVPWLNKLFCGLDQWLIVSTRMLKACLDPDLLNILNEIFHFILPTLCVTVAQSQLLLNYQQGERH